MHVFHLPQLQAIMKTQFAITQSVFSYQLKKGNIERQMCRNYFNLPYRRFPSQDTSCTISMHGAQFPLGSLSLGEDELAASLVPILYNLSLLWGDMICSRLNRRATQSASSTAECQRFRRACGRGSPWSRTSCHSCLPNPHSPVPGFQDPGPAQQGLMDGLCVPLEGSTDYRAELCRKLHHKQARLVEKYCVIG